MLLIFFEAIAWNIIHAKLFRIAYEWSYLLLTKSAGENEIEILVIQYHLIFEIYLHSE